MQQQPKSVNHACAVCGLHVLPQGLLTGEYLYACRLAGPEGNDRQSRPVSAPIPSSLETPGGSAGNTPRGADRHHRKSEGEALPGSVR